MKTPTLLIVSSIFSLSLPVLVNAFDDVPSDHPEYEAISYMESTGIVQGYTNDDGTTSFRPDAPITRVEFFKILAASNFAPSELDECVGKNIASSARTVFFDDVERSHWGAKYVCLLKKRNVIRGSGSDGKKLEPRKNINAVEAMKVLAQIFELSPAQTDPWYRGYVESMAAKNAIPTSITSFNAPITRSQMAEMTYRLSQNITTRPSHTYASLSGEEKITSATSQPQTEPTPAANADYDVLLMETKTKKSLITLFLSNDGRACSLKGTLRGGGMNTLSFDQVQTQSDCLQGTYTKTASQIQISWPELQDTNYGTLTLTKEGNGWRKNAKELYLPPRSAPSSLSGTYALESAGSVGIPGQMSTTSFIKSSYVFSGNQFEYSGFRAASSSISGNFGSSVENMTTSNKDDFEGTYEIAGFRLILTKQDGSQETKTIFISPHDGRLVIDGGRYTKQ